jgi:FMN-dependent NADH-azoreductase
VLGFIGITGVQEVFVEPTMASGTSKEEAVSNASGRATALAGAF